MKKIGVITFHAAHNFGSVLQAYALQSFIENNFNNISYEIINFRTTEQKELYKPLKKWNNLKNVMKNVMMLPFLKQYIKKYDKFEHFIKYDLNITKKEYHDSKELIELCDSYDYYISGSDQIWNVRTKDFSDVYYLSFTKSKNKIAYAPSFGPLEIEWEKYDKKNISTYLKEYNKISVREIGSVENILKLIDKEVPILIDPTMLLTGTEWGKIESKVSVKFEYIFLYCLEPSVKLINKVKEISKIMNLPVVISKYNNKYDYINPFIKMYDVGPNDFISLIKNAKLVISTSFHGTVFSILLHRPFFTIECDKDKRIWNLLKMVRMEKRNLNINQKIINNNDVYNLDFTIADKIINDERIKSKNFLIGALEEDE